MIDFFISLFFAAAMLCLLALPLTVTLFFTKGFDWPSRKKYLIQFSAFLVAFVLCLAISGRIYDASLTPEQRYALESEALAAEAEEKTVSTAE